jgi:hypothetical protein
VGCSCVSGKSHLNKHIGETRKDESDSFSFLHLLSLIVVSSFSRLVLGIVLFLMCFASALYDSKSIISCAVVALYHIAIDDITMVIQYIIDILVKYFIFIWL